MRIIAGERKGLNLSSISGQDIRPTSDKLRGAIFSSLYSILGHNPDVFIDCFSGSGAIGIEAKSRGAKDVYMFDNSGKSIQLIKKNIDRAKYSQDLHISKVNAKKGLTRLGEESVKAEAIFMDPPYKKLNLIYPLLKIIDEHSLLDSSGIIIVEHDKHDMLDKVIGNFCKIKEKTYGNTTLSFYMDKR